MLGCSKDLFQEIMMWGIARKLLLFSSAAFSIHVGDPKGKHSEKCWKNLHLFFCSTTTVFAAAYSIMMLPSPLCVRRFSLCLWYFCTSLQIEALNDFISACLFKDIYAANSLGRQRWCLPPQQRPDRISAYLKNSGALNSDFLSCCLPHSVFRYHLALFPLPCGICVLQNQCKSWFSTFFVNLNNKVLHLWPKSFISSTSFHKTVIDSLNNLQVG